MAVIMIVCPFTDRSVSTGIETDEESFALISEDAFFFKCPACGAAHTWALLNAWLADNPPTPPTPANSN